MKVLKYFHVPAVWSGQNSDILHTFIHGAISKMSISHVRSSQSVVRKW